MLRPCDNSAVAVFDDRGATGTLDLHMPFIALEGETLILGDIFALTAFGFPGQLTLPRRPVATVGTKVTKKDIEEVPTEDNLEETDNVQLDD